MPENKQEPIGKEHKGSEGNETYSSEFDWIPFYRDLAERLIEYRYNQAELIRILREIKAEGIPVISLTDIDEDGNEIELEEIDPFTFFAAFNRGISNDNRIKILDRIQSNLNITSTVPTRFDGIPVVNNLQSRFFPYKNVRNSNDIFELWNLAEQCLKGGAYGISPDTYTYCLGIKTVRVAKLTMGFFWFDPYEFVSLDSVNMAYFKMKNLDLDLNKANAIEGYSDIIKQVYETFQGNEYYRISLDAYLNKINEIKYWAGGYHWGDEDMSEEFISNSYWQIGWSVNDTKGKPFYDLIKGVRENDVFALKSLGGNHIVKIKALGVVTDASERESGILKIKWLKTGELYHGPAPKGEGSGNWFGTLSKINRMVDVEMLLGDRLNYNEFLYGLSAVYTYPLFNREIATPSSRGKKLAQIIFNHLQEINTGQKGNIFGLFGNWGRGKTFLFEQVNELNNNHKNSPFKIVEFSAWRYQETPSIWAYLYEELSKAFYGDNFWKALDNRIYLNLLRLKWDRIPFLMKITVFLGIIVISYVSYNWLILLLGLFPLKFLYNFFKTNHTAQGIFRKIHKKASYEKVLGLQAEIQKDIRILLKAWEYSGIRFPVLSRIFKPKQLNQKQKVLLFVDDIDRCNEEKVVEIIDSLRIMLDDDYISKRLLVMAAVDHRMLGKAIEKKIIKYNNDINPSLVKEYLDKLFIAGLKLPLLQLEERTEILNLILKDYLKENYEEEQHVSDRVIQETVIEKDPEGSGTKTPSEGKSTKDSDTKKQDDSKSTSIREANLTIDQQNALRKCISYHPNMSPRQIRIFFYRYLLFLNILSEIKGEYSALNINSVLLPYLLLHESFDHLLDMSIAEESDFKITVNDNQYTLSKQDFKIIKEALEMVVAY